MKALSATFCLFLFFSCGCAGDPDSMVTEQIAFMNEFATAMENDAPQSQLDTFQDRSKSLNKQFEALNLSTAEKQDLIARHQTELTAATQRLQKAMMKKAMNSFGKGFPGVSPGGAPSFGN